MLFQFCTLKHPPDTEWYVWFFWYTVYCSWKEYPYTLKVNVGSSMAPLGGKLWLRDGCIWTRDTPKGPRGLGSHSALALFSIAFGCPSTVTMVYLGGYIFHIKLQTHCLRYRIWKEVTFFFSFLAMPHSTQDLISPTRDWTHAPCSGSMES